MADVVQAEKVVADAALAGEGVADMAGVVQGGEDAAGPEVALGLDVAAEDLDVAPKTRTQCWRTRTRQKM